MAVAILGPIAMISFGRSLEAQVKPLQLSLEAKAQLRVESARLAETKAPAGLVVESTVAVRRAIKLAFVSAFRTVVGVCAALSWLSSALAACLLKNQLTIDGPGEN